MTWKLHLTVRIALTAGFLALALGRVAHGQEAAPALAPPRLVTFVDAPYPDGAAGGAAVDLEMDVAATGQVARARVVTSAGEAFDQAALAAARRFVFEPARRDGQPIAARIRYRYLFTPPPPPSGVLEGRVLLRGGDDVVRGAAVTVSSADGAVARTGTTGPDGSFSFGDLPPGRYRVRVGGPDLSPVDQPEEVSAGDATSVTYRLQPTGPARPGKELEFGATATIEAPPREVTKRTLGVEELLRVAGTR